MNRMLCRLLSISLLALSLSATALPAEDRAKAKDKSLDFRPLSEDAKKVLREGPYANRVPGPRGAALAGNGGSGHSEMAVFRALRWLRLNQETNGCWRATSGGDGQMDYGRSYTCAMTSLALLAMLAHSNSPADGEFAEPITRGIEWLINNQREDGYFNESDGHEYSLPIAACALSEAYALTGNQDVRRAARRAIWIIVNGHNQSGGWTYSFKDMKRNDTSYMSWCAQAVFAAKSAKLDITGLDFTAERAAIALAGNMRIESGAFGYTGISSSHNDLTGAGVYSLYLLGVPKDVSLAPSIKYLADATFDWQEPMSRSPLYHWIAITQAKFHAGEKEWIPWNKRMAVELVRNQVVVKKAVRRKDRMVDIGYWESPSDREYCKSRVYATALCTLMLETYYRHTPLGNAARR